MALALFMARKFLYLLENKKIDHHFQTQRASYLSQQLPWNFEDPWPGTESSFRFKRGDLSQKPEI